MMFLLVCYPILASIQYAMQSLCYHTQTLGVDSPTATIRVCLGNLLLLLETSGSYTSHYSVCISILQCIVHAVIYTEIPVLEISR